MQKVGPALEVNLFVLNLPPPAKFLGVSSLRLAHFRLAHQAGKEISSRGLMLSIHARIDRAQRLVRMLERDAPLLAVRVAELTPERQHSAKSYAAQLTAHARAELQKLLEEGSYWDPNDPTPHPAD
jgi:hypothetical protein